jgi:hypothetical protein
MNDDWKRYAVYCPRCDGIVHVQHVRAGTCPGCSYRYPVEELEAARVGKAVLPRLVCKHPTRGGPCIMGKGHEGPHEPRPPTP